MSKPKKQHYVPQYYLRGFAVDNRVHVLDKSNPEKTTIAGVNDIAHQNNFYSLNKNMIRFHDDVPIEERVLDPDTGVENLLQEYDGICSKALADVVKIIRANQLLRPKHPQYIYLNERIRFLLGFLFTVQEFRTNEMREKILQFLHHSFDTMTQFLMLHHPDFKDPMPEGLKTTDLTIELNKSVGNILQAKTLADVEQLERIANYLANERIWHIGINKTNIPLITSDNPLVKNNHWPQEIYRQLAILAPGVELCLPISPDLIIFVNCRSTHEAKIKDKKMVKPLFNDLCVELKVEDVKYFNSMQIAQSHSRLFASTDDWDFCKSYINSHPKVKDPFRSRVSMTGARELPEDWGRKKKFGGTFSNTQK